MPFSYADLRVIIEERDGTLCCEVKQDDEHVTDNLSYEWFEGGTPVQLEGGQTTLKLAEQRALFQSKQEYTCTVTYTKGNRRIKSTSNILQKKKNCELLIIL